MLLLSKIRSLQRKPEDQDQISTPCSTRTADDGDDDGQDHVLTSCSTHSVHDEEELLAELECAVVLRWDDKAACWVRDEIEIHDPPPLRRFAKPFGSHTEGDNFYERVQLCAQYNNHGWESSGSTDVLNSAWSQLFEPEPTLLRRPDSDATSPHAGGSAVIRVSDFNLDAPVFVPERNELELQVRAELFSLDDDDLDSNDLVLTSMHTTKMSTFRLGAPEFVPRWTEGESAASSPRTRLNSSASAFVPSSPFLLF